MGLLYVSLILLYEEVTFNKTAGHFMYIVISGTKHKRFFYKTIKKIQDIMRTHNNYILSRIK